MNSSRVKFALYWAVLPILIQFLVDAKNQYVEHHFIHPLAVVRGLWLEIVVVPVLSFVVVYALYPYREAIANYTERHYPPAVEEVEVSPDAHKRKPPAG